MRKKTGILFVIAGAVLILSALLLLFYNRYEDEQAGEVAEEVLSEVEAVIESAQESTLPYEEILPEQNPELPVVEIGGYEYVGYLEIPALELKLPVMAEWDYTRLKKAPCRQAGSSRTDDLVIAAHNYRRHFGKLKDLPIGSIVMFTDMDGICNTYTVDTIDTLNPYAVDEVLNSDADLVLYTCTKGGKTRVTVFCTRA